jgi:glutathione S-transferase
MIKLYGCPRTRSTRASWALEEAAAPYEYERIDLARGEARQPAFLAINPFGKLPVLVDCDLVITESAAIVTYIGEKFPVSGLVPVHPRARAEYFQWSAFAISELEQPLWTLVKHNFVLPEDLRIAAIRPAALWEFARAVKVLDQHMQGRIFVAGDSFSGADIMIGHTLGWAKQANVALESEVLEQYVDRILSRPALEAARQRELG